MRIPFVGLVRYRKIQRYALAFVWLASAFLLYGCGGQGAPTGSSSSSSSSGGGAAGITGGCSSTAPAMVMQENPRVQSPGIAFTANLSSLGINATLTGLDGSCLLKNATFSITSDQMFPGSIANQNSGFIYNPSDPRFQQITSYYYATKLRDGAIASGGDLSTLTGISIETHCVSVNGNSATNNAFFYPSPYNTVCLGSATYAGKKIYASDDGDVVLHEFGHALGHNLSNTTSSSVFYSTFLESGAIDEALADYWALTNTNNPSLSQWYLAVLDANAGNASPVYQRVASPQNNIYPQSMVGEIHFDSRVFSQALWAIRSAIGQTKADRLVVRAITLLPVTLRYKEAVAALQNAAVALGFSAGDKAAINTALTNAGLIRADSAAGVSLHANGVGGAKDIYVIDDHSQSYLSAGNCNGALDVGETAMVLVNLDNSGARIGLGVATLAQDPGVASTGQVTFAPGGNLGEYMRLDGGGADFVTVLKNSKVVTGMGTLNFADDVTLAAAFLVRGVSVGTMHFLLSFSPMGGATVSVPVALNVGNVATSAATCPMGGTSKRSLWPVP